MGIFTNLFIDVDTTSHPMRSPQALSKAALAPARPPFPAPPQPSAPSPLQSLRSNPTPRPGRVLRRPGSTASTASRKEVKEIPGREFYLKALESSSLRPKCACFLLASGGRRGGAGGAGESGGASPDGRLQHQTFPGWASSNKSLQPRTSSGCGSSNEAFNKQLLQRTPPTRNVSDELFA